MYSNDNFGFKFYILCFIFLLTGFASDSAEASAAVHGETNPAVHTINPELIAGADAVIRHDLRRFEYRSPGRGRLYVQKMITILNSDGLSHASIDIPYNNFVNIRSLSGAVYDQEGNRVRRIRSRDFDDESMVSNYSLAEDSRAKKGLFTHSVYPFTIELEYRLDYSGFIQIPAWIPVTHEKTALECAELEVVLPVLVDLNFRMFNVPDENVHEHPEGTEIRYHWQLENLPSIQREVMGPPWFELYPAVVMRMDHFNMEGYDGSMRDWPTFASWFGKLWQGRDELPGYLKQEVDEMVRNHGHTRELIRELYTHLQMSTRYVSIQLGIGGYQTETAIATIRNRYGDCKALSNYLLAMLRYAGIEAYPALIRNGSFVFPFDIDFVHNPFNHAVIAIPFESDTIWVESTSSSFPLGYIGSSNSNRHALIFTENGGEMVRTPRLDSNDNYQIRKATVQLLDDGSATAEIHTRYGGYQHESIRSLTRQLPRAQFRHLESQLPFSLFEIVHSSVEADPAEPEAVVDLDVAIQSFSTRIGSRFMFHPNIMERGRGFTPPAENRKQPVYTGSAYHDTDEIAFQIPEGYQIEAIPAPVELEFEYGNYSSTVTPSDDGTELYYRREILMRPGKLPAAEFETYRSFINEMVQSDNSQVVLVRM